MSTKDFTANVISASKVVPDSNLQTGKASGVWDLNEVLDLVKGGNWPTFGNVVTNSDDVFSTFVYKGTSATKVIDNGINLSGEGGLVWTKVRDQGTTRHVLIDTARGVEKYLESNTSDAEDTQSSNSLTAFNNNGYTIGNWGSMNSSSYNYCSWTFRKQPKFFDIVTYTGNNATQTINHNLGSVPGMIIVKRLNDAGNWGVKHRSIDATDGVFLNKTDQRADNATYWGDTEPTSTQFTVGTTHSVDSAPYVAYLFAHNDGDGEFGPTQDQDIIKCGSYTGDGGAGTTEVDLGFEPQWILVKASSAADSWYIIDNMRGWGTHNNKANDAYLFSNATNSESVGGVLDITPTGFRTTLYSNANVNGRTYIYMAIRRGGMATPTTPSDVFAISTNGQAGDSTAPAYRSTFPVDMFLETTTAGSSWYLSSRLTYQQYMKTDASDAEATDSNLDFDYMNGVYTSTGSNSAYHGWMWKRARGYFDVATWTGTGSSLNVSHNLGVEPEMIWVKTRSNAVGWAVYHNSQGFSKGSRLETSDAFGTETNRVTGASSTTFTVGTDAYVNVSARTYIAYLFATVAGVSKVGSYTGNGTSQTIDCGFSNGAKFVLVKQSSSTGSWFVFDTTRGINSGNDDLLQINATGGSYTGADYIDPDSSGFIAVGDSNNMNTNGQTFIFYAIANDPS